MTFDRTTVFCIANCLEPHTAVADSLHYCCYRPALTGIGVSDAKLIKKTPESKHPDKKTVSDSKPENKKTIGRLKV